MRWSDESDSGTLADLAIAIPVVGGVAFLVATGWHWLAEILGAAGWLVGGG